jgi:hypothetical protein
MTTCCIKIQKQSHLKNLVKFNILVDQVEKTIRLEILIRIIFAYFCVVFRIQIIVSWINFKNIIT